MNTWSPKRNPFGQFAPGSGGRPRGARNRAGRELRNVFEESMRAHIVETLDEARRKNSLGYLRLLMKAVPTPTEDEVDPAEILTPEQADERLRDYCARLIAAGYGPRHEDSPPPSEAEAGAPAGGTPMAPSGPTQAHASSEAGPPHEIDVSDLDPGNMAHWTEEQAARCELSGLLEELTEKQRHEFEARRGHWRKS